MKNQQKFKKKKRRHNSEPLTFDETCRYSDSPNFDFVLPHQFVLLCKLMEVVPSQVVKDFIRSLDCGSWEREKNKHRDVLVQYFIDQGYGQRHYSPREIRQIFTEMDAIGMLFPYDAGMRMIRHHARWRKKYHKYWFRKWFEKPRRKV